MKHFQATVRDELILMNYERLYYRSARPAERAGIGDENVANSKQKILP